MFRDYSIIKAFSTKQWLSSPTMHGEEAQFMMEAYNTNWMSTVGRNIDEAERMICEKTGRKYAVGLSSGTAALHMAVRLAGERLYGQPATSHGTLEGHKVFCTDVTFDATVNPVVYENGEPVFIDTEYDTWNMNPDALEKAFEIYPDVKLVVYVHLYGTPAKADKIIDICHKHGALLIEDAAESLGASLNGIQTGMYGDYSIVSFNGNKIITGSSGGMFLTDEQEAADKIRKWSTQSREPAPWYQHTELGYNYRMSNVIAGVIRGQILHLEEHIKQKKQIYLRYKEGLIDLPISMNPFGGQDSAPNYWLSCMLVDKNAMCWQDRNDLSASYKPESGKSCPTEILDVINKMNAEGRPIWKPMHMQPIFNNNAFVPADESEDVGRDIFERGLCLPSDNKMTEDNQDRIIDYIRKCFE